MEWDRNGWNIGNNQYETARVWGSSEVGDVEGTANARLIAAAPEMLEALREAEARFRTIECTRDFVEPYTRYAAEKVRAAIAKAEGRTP